MKLKNPNLNTNKKVFALRLFIGEKEIFPNKCIIVIDTKFNWVFMETAAWKAGSKYNMVMADLFYEFVKEIDEFYGVNRKLFKQAGLDYDIILEGLKYNILVQINKNPIGCDNFGNRCESIKDYIQSIFNMMKSYLSCILFVEDPCVDHLYMPFYCNEDLDLFVIFRDDVSKEYAMEYVEHYKDLFNIAYKVAYETDKDIKYNIYEDETGVKLSIEE